MNQSRPLCRAFVLRRTVYVGTALALLLTVLFPTQPPSARRGLCLFRRQRGLAQDPEALLAGQLRFRQRWQRCVKGLLPAAGSNS